MKLMNNSLTQYTQNSFKAIDYLVAIPLHPARLREREFNQSELIAKELSRELQKPLVPALKKIRHTKSQTALNRTQRLLNLAGAFAINDNICIKDKNILLVDDVATTTATITEAASLLKKSGAHSICALTFAKGSNNEDPA
ncbi:MAG: phosphoribosyltransferase family protein [Candidatus Omnitrophota bacterium]